MTESIRVLVENFAQYSKEYPIVAAGIGMWALGVGTYLLRTIPLKLWGLFVKHATTTLTMASTHISYHDFLRWFEENEYSHNSRSIKISNGRYGYEDMIKAMGYGTHYFMFGWTPVRLTMSQKETQASERERDEIKMTVLGRSHRTFDRIFTQIKESKEKKTDKVAIMKYKDDWVLASEQRKRSLDSVCLNKGVKDDIINFVESFREREQFHLNHGINHQTAVLLYGPPGTGKTSVVKAIASHFDMTIYNMSPSSLLHIATAFQALPEDSLVVIEDIDSNKALYARTKLEQSPAKTDEEPTESKAGRRRKNRSTASNEASELPFGAAMTQELLMSGLTSMSDVLNAIDGVSVAHGRILLATTNHPEKLDPALLRSGRFDLKIEIGYADNYAMGQFLERFFPGETLPDDYQIKDGVCPADIQSAAIECLDDPQEFLKRFEKQDSELVTEQKPFDCRQVLVEE